MNDALVVIPTYGRKDLTDSLLSDIDSDCRSRGFEVVIVDNLGDYDLSPGFSATVFCPGHNLRWIGTVNWAIELAVAREIDACLVLNNDIRMSPRTCCILVELLASLPRAAVVAPVYDDYWPHQRATAFPASAALYEARSVERAVPFCDGTVLCLRVSVVKALGGLDDRTFSWHGYGSDIDLGIRIRQAGWQSWVTERCYVSHLRRGTMDVTPGMHELLALEEYQGGLLRKWGPDWRTLAGGAEPLVDPHWEAW